jgi:hypothetical protein
VYVCSDLIPFIHLITNKEYPKMSMCEIPFSFSKVRRSFTSIKSLILLFPTPRCDEKYIFVEAFRCRIPYAAPAEGDL